MFSTTDQQAKPAFTAKEFAALFSSPAELSKVKEAFLKAYFVEDDYDERYDSAFGKEFYHGILFSSPVTPNAPTLAWNEVKSIIARFNARYPSYPESIIIDFILTDISSKYIPFSFLKRLLARPHSTSSVQKVFDAKQKLLNGLHTRLQKNSVFRLQLDYMLRVEPGLRISHNHGIVKFNKNAQTSEEFKTREVLLDDTTQVACTQSSSTSSIQSVKCIPDKKSWDQYNVNNINYNVTYWDEKSNEKFGRTYSHVFFQLLNLGKYLNVQCKNMIQFGSSASNFLSDFKQHGWTVKGYDYCDEAIAFARLKSVPSMHVDLNNLNDGKLSYEAELNSDLSTPTNIMLIRILLYLDTNALIIFMFNIMDKAQPGSVFFVSGLTDNKRNDLPYTVENLTKNPLAFFAPRTDMDILLGEKILQDDTVYVIRKR